MARSVKQKPRRGFKLEPCPVHPGSLRPRPVDYVYADEPEVVHDEPAETASVGYSKTYADNWGKAFGAPKRKASA
jgi:hypothetical protein